jgi:phosphoribosylamine--glycine ligase
VTTILVIGSGGREHALAWRLACGAGDTPLSDRRVVVCPGNAGIARELRCRPAPHANVDGYVEVALEEKADLVVVGPEAPLVEGLTDALHAAGVPVLGPPREAARLEGEKSYMKDAAAAAGVPTARYGVFEALEEALGFIDGFDDRVVVKADGLCAGKGVVVAEDLDEARAAVHDMLGSDGAPRFGEASRRVVIEEFLPGKELSVISLCDGEHAVPFAPARDHKRLLDGDEGPNTGGMGAVAPLGADQGISPDLVDEILDRVVRPTLRTMERRAAPFRGFLYAGLMLEEGREPKLLEYNVRFGDPEAQAVLYGTPIDLLEPFLTVAKGGSLGRDLDLLSACRPSATVVAASPGYPTAPKTGSLIHGLDDAARHEHTKVFFAGVKQSADGLLTGGGRVLAATATGATHSQALERSYAALDAISFDGMQVRRDIGASL